MRKAIFTIILVPFLSFTLNGDLTPKELKLIRKHLIKTFGVKVDHDAFDQLLWVKSAKPAATTALVRSSIDIYFNFQKNGLLGPKRFRFKYFASDWLFIDEISFLVGGRNEEQKVYKIKVDYDDRLTDVLSGGIYEKIDIAFTKEVEAFFEDILSREKNSVISYRISGKSSYVTAANWTGKFKKMAKPVYETYNHLLLDQYKKILIE